MSLFAMGYNQLEVNEAKLTMAELELDSLTSMFNKYVFLFFHHSPLRLFVQVLTTTFFVL